MIRKVLLAVAGSLLVVAGLLGLVLPVVPGILFLVAGAACLSIASTRFQGRLEGRLNRHPRCRAALRRWHASDGLPAWRRLQLAMLLTIRSLLPVART